MNAYAVSDWDELEATYFGKSTGTSDYVPQPVYGYPAPSGYGYAPQNIPAEMPSRALPDPKTRKKAEAERLRRQELLEAHKLKERYISGKRFKEALAISLGIAIVAGMFAFLLYRQSQITSLNFQNNAVQKKITALEQETRQIEEDLVANADLTQIRWDAMERLGMQEPGGKQIMVVELPAADQLVTNSSGTSSVSSKSSLASAKVNLAQYYSSLR